MAKPKAKFKKGDTFIHPTQNLFVVVDEVNFYQGTDKGFLYTLKCYLHEKDQAKPWKRYYESKVISELVPLKSSNAVKVLYGN